MKHKLCLTLIALSFILSAIILSGCDENNGLDIDLPDIDIDAPDVDGGGSETIRGSGELVSENIPVSDFDSVSLLGIGQVLITQGDRETLRVTADDNIMSYVEARVRNGTLTLGFNDEGQDKNFRPSDGIQFHLSVKDLSGVELLGAGDFDAPSLNTERLEITLNGAGDVSVGALTAQEIIVQLNGVGNVELAGQVLEQGVFLNGVGDYRAADLESQTAIVELNGVGSVTLWATDSLDARVPGPGTVQYYGSPQVTQDVSLVGRVVGLGDK